MHENFIKTPGFNRDSGTDYLDYFTCSEITHDLVWPTNIGRFELHASFILSSTNIAVRMPIWRRLYVEQNTYGLHLGDVAASIYSMREEVGCRLMGRTSLGMGVASLHLSCWTLAHLLNQPALPASANVDLRTGLANMGVSVGAGMHGG